MNPLVRLYPGDQAVVVVATTLVLATVVIFAAFLLSRIAARHNAAARSTLWLCALLCVLLGPLVTFGLQRAGVSIVQMPLYTSFAPAASVAPSGNFAPPWALPDSTPVEDAPRKSDSPPADRTAEAKGLSAVVNRSGSQTGGELWRATAGAVVGIWVLGLLAHVARFLFGYRSLLILRRDVQPIDERLDRVRDAVHRALGIRSLPRIVTSPRVTCPLAAGGPVRPLVILPDTLLPDLDDEQLRDILIHECAHVVQHDFFVGMAQRLAEMLYWPFPPVRYLNRELTAAREEICDNYVLRHSDGPRYAQTLLKLSHAVPVAATPVGACGSLDSGTTLETRIARLLDDRRKPMTQLNGWMRTVIAVAFMAMMTSIAGTRLLRAEPAGTEPQAGAAATTLAVASAQTPVGASESRAAIAAIEKLGGRVEVDETRPGRPVVKVNLYRTRATDADLVHLKGFTNLEELDLKHTQVTDQGLQHLRGLTGLRSLLLDDTKITDAGLAHLRGLVNLEFLGIDNNPLTGAGLVHLKGLTKLRTLDLDNTQISNAELVHLNGLTHLQTLDLTDTKIGDAGLVHLKGLPKLSVLWLGSLTFGNLTEGSVEDAVAIRKARAAYATALNRRDARAIAPLYAPDATVRFLPSGATLYGRTQIARSFARNTSRNEGMQVRLSVDFIHFVKPDVALLGGIWEGIRPGEASRKYRNTATYIKRNGKWLIENTQMWRR